LSAAGYVPVCANYSLQAGRILEATRHSEGPCNLTDVLGILARRLGFTAAEIILPTVEEQIDFQQFRFAFEEEYKPVGPTPSRCWSRLFRKVQFHPIQTPQFLIPPPQPLPVGRTVLPSALNQHSQPQPKRQRGGRNRSHPLMSPQNPLAQQKSPR
jgi:hypothetical protein